MEWTGEPFFFWCYPQYSKFDKFGHELVNGTPVL